MKIKLQVRTTAYVLAGIIVGLVLANLVFHLGRLELGWGQSYGFRRQFNLGSESNVPTFYSAAALVGASVLSFLIGKFKLDGRDRFRIHWLVMGIGFLILAVDEATMIHESAFRIPRALGLEHIGTLAWLLPYALILPAVAVAYFPFLLHLEARYRRLFILAALLLVGGALGMEVVGDQMTAAYGEAANWPRILAVTVEELLEMCGSGLFIVTLLLYMREKIGSVSISLR